MKHLEQLQHDFQHSLLADDSRHVLPAITAAGRTAPGKQLSVYANAYRSRLREVLQTDYPVLAAALGGQAFDELALAYIDACHSQGYSLRSFGAHLADFLNTQPDFSQTPVLAELAGFEWALGRAFDAADTTLVTVKGMADTTPDRWPELRLVFHASVQRSDFEWNTPALWQAYKSERPIPEVQKNPAPVPWLIWRRDLSVHFRSLEDHEPLLLDRALQGASFGNLCEVLGHDMPKHEVALYAASTLKRWVSDGLVSGIR